jgi:hypothetical protein
MNAIAGIPYLEAEFDKKGALTSPAPVLPDKVTDLFVVSHGWNNDKQEAEALYEELFTNFMTVGDPADLAGRSLAIIGVIWPSKKFDELVAASGEDQAGEGGASLNTTAANDPLSLAVVAAKLDGMERFFSDPSDVQRLRRARTLLPDLEDKATARRQFVEELRALLDPSAANKEDASTRFFKDDGNDIMKNLQIADKDLDKGLSAPQGGASLPVGAGAAAGVGGAVGFKQKIAGFLGAAMNVLNFTTYYEMKARAGTVGRNGVGPLVDRLAPRVDRIHLVGHSFGGRVVTAAAAASTTDKIRSMSLLQTAFSHNGFSKQMDGFFRSVVENNRVHGPILVTHTHNDRAVGIAYPLASRLSGDQAAALGDKNDKFGGLGRNGAQKMETGETTDGVLLDTDGAYTFAAGRFFNLEASTFISGHSDVRGRQVAYAIRCAVR